MALPAAVAAKAAHPERTVVCFGGDGCFLMNGQELATAVQYGLAIIVIVVNNGMYGTIRMHQEREYPERVQRHRSREPGFRRPRPRLRRSRRKVETTADFAPLSSARWPQAKPALLELRLDPEAITPRMGLSQIRENARKARGG